MLFPGPFQALDTNHDAAPVAAANSPQSGTEAADPLESQADTAVLAGELRCSTENVAAAANAAQPCIHVGHAWRMARPRSHFCKSVLACLPARWVC